MSRSVLITGCASGFGRLLVPAFLDAGWQVVATMRGMDSRRTLFKEELEAYPGSFHLLELDVTSPRERAAAADFVKREFSGRLDALVNNAGYGLCGAIEDLSEPQIRHQMEVNFFGLVLTTQALLPALRTARGKVIHISSVLGFSSLPLHALYCASKHAVEGLAETMDHELSTQGVRTVIIEPGGFDTKFSANRTWGEKSGNPSSAYSAYTAEVRNFIEKRPRGAFGRPEAVARAVVRAAGMRRPPLRIRCGKDARLVAFLQAVLPRNIFSSFIRRMFRRVMTAR